jgi:DNA primase
MAWYEQFVEHACSQVDERIVESLNARGVSDAQIREFQIGYIDRALPDTIELPQDFLNWSHHGAKLEDVYVFPLTNILGEVHGLQFRHVKRDRTGYLDYYQTRGEAVLFGLGQAAPHIWRTGSIHFVEGTFDHFPVQRHDPTAVATLTARVVESLIWFMRRTCKRVVVGYDNDPTGRRGAESFRKVYGAEFEVVDLKYPKIPLSNGKTTKDPGDIWELWGDKRFGAFLSEHVPASNLMEW